MTGKRKKPIGNWHYSDSKKKKKKNVCVDISQQVFSTIIIFLRKFAFAIAPVITILFNILFFQMNVCSFGYGGYQLVRC